MSPAGGDASQGTFFEVYGNLLLLYFLYYKKSVQDGIVDSFAHMPHAGGVAPQGTFFEIYGNLIKLYFLYYEISGFIKKLLFFVGNLIVDDLFKQILKQYPHFRSRFHTCLYQIASGYRKVF